VVLRVKDGRVFRLDGSNGEVAWSRHLGKDLNRGPLVASDGTVYVTDWDLTVHALNPADGSTRWAAQKGSVTSMALDSHDTLYLARDYGGVCAVDPATGQDLWKMTPTVGPRSLDNARPAISFWQAPAGDGDLDSTKVLLNPSLHDRIVATCDGGQVYALDARNGNLDWAVLPGARGSMPHPEVLPDGTVVVGCGDYNVYGLDPDTGRQLWSWAIPRGDQPRPTAGADGRVYCRDDQGVLHASRPPQREDPLKKVPETGPGSVAPTTIQVEEQWVDVGGVRIPRRRSS
jgi:outer membrane protein assembly factor BamB